MFGVHSSLINTRVLFAPTPSRRAGYLHLNCILALWPNSASFLEACYTSSCCYCSGALSVAWPPAYLPRWYHTTGLSSSSSASTPTPSLASSAPAASVTASTAVISSLLAVSTTATPKPTLLTVVLLLYKVDDLVWYSEVFDLLCPIRYIFQSWIFTYAMGAYIVSFNIYLG